MRTETVGHTSGAMAKAGDRLENPITGEDLTFHRVSADTGGELLEVQASWNQHSAEPVAHSHPRQDEHFEVLEGALTARVDGVEQTYGPGEAFEVPAGSVHAMWNSGGSKATAVWQVRPALSTETFFETVWGLARDGKVNSKGVPSPLQAAVLMRAYSDVFRLAKPQALVQRLVFGLLAPIGRLRGYRARYERYSGAS